MDTKQPRRAVLGMLMTAGAAVKAATVDEGTAVKASSFNEGSAKLVLTGGSGAQQRANDAFRLRRDLALLQRDQSVIQPRTNGDEQLYPNYIGNYSKGLPHNAQGEVDPSAYAAFLKATESGQNADYEAIPLGGKAKLADPQAGYAYDLIGKDSHKQLLAPPPALASAEASCEMVELYWQALTRDVPFSQFRTDPTILNAVSDLSFLSAFTGPKQNGHVTTDTLFRGATPGDLNGPYVSQFLYRDVPYGPSTIVQKYRTPRAGIDFLTGYGEWLSVQNGNPATMGFSFNDAPRYIVNQRDLAWFVHQDFSFQAYLNACLMLLSAGGAPVSDSNPYRTSKTQGGFSTFGAPHILDLVTNFANAGLRAAWYGKWQVHRRLRPEAFGGLIHNHLTGAAKYPIEKSVLNSAALKASAAVFGTYLHPSAYPEGSPTHPAYTAGHAVIAGACVTALKAFFNETAVVTNPVVPSDDGQTLVPYTSGVLTVGDELNKLAANISLARNAAGVHYRSDGINGLLLGESVAIGMLRDLAYTYTEPFQGFNFTKFDGSRASICPQC